MLLMVGFNFSLSGLKDLLNDLLIGRANGFA